MAKNQPFFCRIFDFWPLEIHFAPLEKKKKESGAATTDNLAEKVQTEKVQTPAKFYITQH